MVSFSALAHTPYLKPFSFEPVAGDRVTLDASFAEKFFVPEAAFNSDTFVVITPSGESVAPESKVDLKTRTVLEHALPEEGTYRFSTGSRFGAVFRTYELDGERRSVRGDEEPIPEGANVILHFQSVTKAEAYVSKGAPSNTVLAAQNSGLEIVPVSHPNNLFAGDAFEFQVLFDGEPMANFELNAHHGRDQFSEDKGITLTTDAQGKAVLTAENQGVYLIFARHRAPAPSDAAAPTYSHTTTLTVEVF